VLINPSFLWGDLGWYLSFAAFSGVIILAPLLMNYFWSKSKPGAISRVLVETASAQILTMPIIAFAFGHYAPLALLSNLMVLPLIPIAMLMTFVSGVASILSGTIGGVIAFPAQLVLNYMTFITQKLADLPISQGIISFSFSYLIVAYLAIFILAIWLWRRTKHDFSEDSIIE